MVGERRSELASVMSKINQCSIQLQAWNRASFDSVKIRLQKAEKHLSNLVAAGLLGLRQSKLKEAKKEVHRWLEREEAMWQQRSKITWLKDGDRNTSYFHNKASVRRKKNHIQRIKDDAGNWQEAGNRDNVLIDYFTNLFSSSTHDPDLSFLNHIVRDWMRVCREH